MASPESTDLGAMYFFNAHRKAHAGAAEAARLLTTLGDNWVLWAVAVAAAVGFLFARRYWSALFLCLALLAADGVSRGTKEVVKRSRPTVTQPTLTVGGWSFPSGHATESAALYGGLALLLARRLRRPWPALVLAAGGLLPLMIGATRLFLCVHYLTDVLAGWCAGGALALLCAWADVRIEAVPPGSGGDSRGGVTR